MVVSSKVFWYKFKLVAQVLSERVMLLEIWGNSRVAKWGRL